MENDATLIGKEFLQLEFLPVKYPVSEVPDPVAQADDAAVVGNIYVEGQVAVAKDEVFDGGIFFQFLSGKLHLVLPVSSHKGTNGPGFLAALSGPAVGESHGCVGVDAGIKPLGDPVFEYMLERSILPVALV